MLSIAPPYLEHALDLPLDFPLDTPLDVATFNDILARIKAMSPLVATDSRLLNPANAGRPLSGGDVAGFDGVTQSVTVASLTGTETVTSSDGTSTVSVVAGALNFTAGTSANIVLSNGGIYPLGETTGTTALDSSGNGNHGTYVNSPTLNVPDNTVPYCAWNQLGGSERMYFDGASVVQSVIAGLPIGDSERNIKAEFFGGGLNTPVTQGRIFSYGTNVPGKAFDFCFEDEKIVFRHNGGNRITTNTFDFNAIHQLEVIVPEGATTTNDVLVKVNGNLEAMTRGGGSNQILATASSNFFVGEGFGGEGFSGVVAEVSIANDEEGLNVIASYLGTGNQDSDWLDQIGSNNGTVTGGSTIRIPRNESNTALDVLGNAVQYSGTAYPVLPDITGGTAAALTAFNTNISTASTQPPEILAAAIPATWVHADGSVPLLQVKDNGDSTSSLALGLPVAPTTEEQETIDKYHE